MDNTNLIVIGIIVLGFLLLTYGWLEYLKNKDKEARAERWELYERVREPEGKALPPEIIDTEVEKAKREAEKVEIRSDSAINSTPPVLDEWDAVGKIDPTLPLRGKDGPEFPEDN